MNLLDLIFPKYCVNCKKYGDYLCPNCFAKLSFDTISACIVCGNPSPWGLTHASCKTKFSANGSFTAVASNHIVNKLVFKFKNKPYLSNLVSYMTDLMYEKLIQEEMFTKLLKQRPVLVPIPITKEKEKKRGYNQSKILAKHLARKFGLNLLDCLIIVKETKSQKGLGKKERRENVSGAFSINSNLEVPKVVLLIDDVLSSGATINEAVKTLKKAGAKSVWGLAFTKMD